MRNEKLVELGYRVVSRKHKHVSRIDRPDWKDLVANYFCAWDINEGYEHMENFSECGNEDTYRRMLSKDVLTVDSIEGIPNSNGAETGYIKKTIKRPKFCGYCGQPISYNHTYDSYCCYDCDRWLEPECGCVPPENCEFTGRTEKPSQAPSHSFDKRPLDNFPS